MIRNETKKNSFTLSHEISLMFILKTTCKLCSKQPTFCKKIISCTFQWQKCVNTFLPCLFFHPVIYFFLHIQTHFLIFYRGLPQVIFLIQLPGVSNPTENVVDGIVNCYFQCSQYKSGFCCEFHHMTENQVGAEEELTNYLSAEIYVHKCLSENFVVSSVSCGTKFLREKCSSTEQLLFFMNLFFDSICLLTIFFQMLFNKEILKLKIKTFKIIWIQSVAIERCTGYS